MRRGIRLPLQIGTTSLWGMTRAALLLVPGVLLTPFGLIGGVGVLWASDGGEVALGIAAVLIGTPLMLVWIALLQLGGMLRARPSDAVLDEAGLRVEGGKHGGITLAWTQLDPQRCSLRDVTNKELTLGDMYKSEQESTGTAMTHLVVEREGQPALVLAEAEAPEERESLAALYTSIQVGAWRGEVGEEDVTREVVRCAACGAAVVPGQEERVKCHRCGEPVEMPAEVRQRVRVADEGRSARGAAAGLVTRLIDQPGATRTNLLFVLGGAAMLLAWPASLAIGIWDYTREDLDAARVLSLLVFPLAMIPGLYALLRVQLVDRFALRLLTLDLGAREPKRTGDPYGCHACGGPLVVRQDEVVVRCVYCDADNVLGLDLRARTGHAREAAKSLDAALAWRTRERRYWRWRLGPALALTLLGALLLWRATRATPQSHTLTAVGGVLERVTDHPGDEHMPSRAVDGRLAVVRGAEELAVVVDGEKVGVGTWPAWDADGAVLALRGGSVIRFADDAKGFLRPSFGLGVTRIAGSGTLAVSFADGLVGVATVGLLGEHGRDGGHARAGTRGRDAAVTADGQRLAFVRDVDGVAQVFSTTVGSTGWRQWTTDAAMKSQPTWAPDGRRLVWVVDAGTESDPQRNLWIAGDDGSPARALTDGDADADQPFWGADGWVYFAAHAYGRSDIFRIDPEDGPMGAAIAEEVVLRPGPAGAAVERLTDDVHHEHDPVLSPDGATLAFARTRSIDGDIKHMGVVLRAMADGGERVLREYDKSVESQQWARSPEWMPDGASLVYVLATEFGTLRRADPNKGTHMAEVLMDAGELAAGLARPRVSPDGRTIAVERRATANAAWEVLLRAADGTITQVGPGTRVAWRADGAAFAFVRFAEGKGRVMLATLADPTTPTPMATGDHDVRGVAWHPDGRLIIEAGVATDRADLLVIDEAGAAVKLVDGTGDHGRHSVGRDGWVYFTSDVMGQLDVWRVRLK